VEEGREFPPWPPRQAGVVNYFRGLRFCEQNAAKKTISHEEFPAAQNHAASDGSGTAGRYRTIAVQVGRYVPPPPEEVSV